MEPPFKRPRLLLFESRQPATSPDLETARINNDQVLKSRFEAIFEKYSQDFSDVGDEINILTGEIIVNRGHIERMLTEDDPGQTQDKYGAVNGKSLLRAMTVEVEQDDGFYPGPDDVLQSIEIIAENAGLIDDVSPDESEDDLFDTRPSSTTRSNTDNTEQYLAKLPLCPYESDEDSLFEHADDDRSASDDSLFDRMDEDQEGIDERTKSVKSSEIPRSSVNPLNEDEEILARFGPDIGQEVLELLDQRQDAHVEPAWKIPVRIEIPQVHRSTPRIHSSSSADISPGKKANQSLWRPSRSITRRIPPEPVDKARSREESEDPLQEGFSRGHSSQHSDRSDTYGDENEEEFVQEDYYEKSLMKNASDTGVCAFCDGQYGNKSGVMAHWDRYIKRPANKIANDDPHDLCFIRRIRSHVVRRSRPLRLVLYDFRTMVELHEGAGYSFEQIAQQKILRTRKPGVRLQDVYDKHRTPPEVRRTPEPVREWTPSEELTLSRYSDNPTATVATIRRELGDRTELEIGNKLAEIWLAQLRRNKGIEDFDLESHHIPQQVPESMMPPHNGLRGQQDNGEFVIKEESEDELFN